MTESQMQFIGILAAFIAPTMAAIWAAVLSHRNSDKLDEVRVSVNGKLDAALLRIKELDAVVASLKTLPLGVALERVKELDEIVRKLRTPDGEGQHLHLGPVLDTLVKVQPIMDTLTNVQETVDAVKINAGEIPHPPPPPGFS